MEYVFSMNISTCCVHPIYHLHDNHGKKNSRVGLNYRSKHVTFYHVTMEYVRALYNIIDVLVVPSPFVFPVRALDTP